MASVSQINRKYLNRLWLKPTTEDVDDLWLATMDQYVDPQRDRLYDWEEGFLATRRRLFASIYTARRWIKWACEKFDVPVPTVAEQPPNRGVSCFRPIDNRILLLKTHWNPWCALHEAAHAICDHKWGILGHGPKFLSVLIWLLKESDVAPISALTASAKAAKLKFNRPAGPGARRKRPKAKVKGSKRKSKRS